jgi:hypothetical protein
MEKYGVVAKKEIKELTKGKTVEDKKEIMEKCGFVNAKPDPKKS